MSSGESSAGVIPIPQSRMAPRDLASGSRPCHGQTVNTNSLLTAGSLLLKPQQPGSRHLVPGFFYEARRLADDGSSWGFQTPSLTANSPPARVGRRAREERRP